MADYKKIFISAEHQNWAKCFYAFQVGRLGLLELCKNEIEDFHLHVISQLPPETIQACTHCTTTDIIPYSRPGHKCRQGHCRCPSKPCPNGICDILKAEIEREHRYTQISWKNTNIRDWCLSSWEMAKCYFPMDGYKGKTKPEDTDFNGIITLIKNNKIFERCFSPQNFHAKFDKVSLSTFVYKYI